MKCNLYVEGITWLCGDTTLFSLQALKNISQRKTDFLETTVCTWTKPMIATMIFSHVQKTHEKKF